MIDPGELELAEGEAHVWWAHARPRPATLLALLDPIESTRLSTFRRPADRDRFASAHALTRVVLAGYLRAGFPDEVAIRATCTQCGAEGHGKPELHDVVPEFTFSLTHAGARVGVAVARVPVGLDVEVVAEPDPGAIAAGLAASESARLDDLDAAQRPHAFARTWTRKEALLKATGDGLAVDPTTVVVTAAADDPGLVSWADGPPPDTVQLIDLAPGAGHVGALALLTEHPLRVSEHDGEPVLEAAAEPPSIA